MNVSLTILLIAVTGFVGAQTISLPLTKTAKVIEIDNALFKNDNFWRGADGAATVELSNGRILWLFSDSFIDPKGRGHRSRSKMINNSIAIQDNQTLEKSNLTFYYKRNNKNPKSYFELAGDNWFWTGHGIIVKDKLVIFLFEEKETHTGIGFEAVGWHIAIIDNPNEMPNRWDIKYVKGPDTYGVIVGSSAVLKDSTYVYAYGVQEPGTHEVYLLRMEIDRLILGDLDNPEWWVDNRWTKDVSEEPKSSVLFTGQTEFSVHFDSVLNKYIQIQTYGFGAASVGYRLADQLQGPWSEPVIIYTPVLNDPGDFVYSANAHPELVSDGIIISYNINTSDFRNLLNNEDIYFPKLIKLKFKQE